VFQVSRRALHECTCVFQVNTWALHESTYVVPAQQEVRQTQCRLVERGQHVGGNCRLHLQGKEGHASGTGKGAVGLTLLYMQLFTRSAYFSVMKMETADSSDTLVSIYQTARRHISEASNRHSLRTQSPTYNVMLSIHCVSLTAISFLIFQAAAF
jgi:hypothetical protein